MEAEELFVIWDSSRWSCLVSSSRRLPPMVIIGIMGAGMVCAAAAFIAFVRKDDSRNTKPKKLAAIRLPHSEPVGHIA